MVAAVHWRTLVAAKKAFLKKCKADRMMATLPESLDLINLKLMEEPSLIFPALVGIETKNLPGMQHHHASTPVDDSTHWDTMGRAAKLPKSWLWSFLCAQDGATDLTPVTIELMEAQDKHIVRKLLAYTTGVLDTTPFHAAMCEKLVCARTLAKRIELLGGGRLKNLLERRLTNNTGVVDWLGAVYELLPHANDAQQIVAVKHISGAVAPIVPCPSGEM